MPVDVSPRLAWLLGLLSMLAVFLFFSRSHGVRYAFMLSLLWGKILAGIYWLLGLDLPPLTLYRCQGGYGCYPVLTVTAGMAILALLLLTNALAYAWREIRGELGVRAGPLPGLPAQPGRGAAGPPEPPGGAAGEPQSARP